MTKFLINHEEVTYEEFSSQLETMVQNEIKERDYYNSYLENALEEEPMSERKYFREQLYNAYDELDNNDEILILNTVFSITK